MKTKTMACALAILTPLFIALLTPFLGGSAQSGEGSPMPAPTLELRKLPEEELDGAINQNADKYKLIFPTGVEDQFLYTHPPRNRKERKQREKLRKRDAERRAEAYQDSFLEQLNLAGEQGYRLISTTEEMAIARLDGVQYEYATFDMTDGSWAEDGFKEKFDELSKQGFSLADHVIVYYRCETEDSSGAMLVAPYCFERHRFFLERVKGTTTPARYEIAEFIPQISWFRILKGDVILKGDALLTAKVNNLISAGLSPTHILYKNWILLQPIAYRSRPFSEKPEAQVITGGDKWLRKKVNELAQQGFRLALNHDSAALMYRNRSVTTPVSYFWLYAMDGEKKKKTLEAELAQLGNSGAIYRTILSESDGNKFNLIFEKPSTPDGERSEYITLGFQLSDVENAPMKRVETDLTPESKENLKTLNRLVKEGFEVCDMFDLGYTNASNYGVLLERRIAVR